MDTGDRTSEEVIGEAPHRLEIEQLCELIGRTAQLDLHRQPGPQLAELVRSIFSLETVAVFDADLHEVYRSGNTFGSLDELVQSIYLFETVSDDRDTGMSRRVLRIGDLPIGALLLRGEISGLAAGAIASLIAITFDRYHSLANESRTEIARQTEQLRATVLDSLAHAYKTPLTAIRAAGTGLSEIATLTPAQSELVALIDEQAELLSQLTTRLLKTARLETKDLALRLEPVAVAPLIDDIVASLRNQLSAVEMKVCVTPDDLSIRCDRGLLISMLTQYLDDAGKYAATGTTVTVEAGEAGAHVIFSVCSTGPVIPSEDHERIFDRYFRSSVPANKASGTGIGLSIAKQAAQAHGGYVWVTSDSGGETTFFASLPQTCQDPRAYHERSS